MVCEDHKENVCLMYNFKNKKQTKENDIRRVNIMTVFIWQSGSSAGIQYGEETPPIFFGGCQEDLEEEIAELKKSGATIKRVDHKDDLHREISF